MTTILFRSVKSSVQKHAFIFCTFVLFSGIVCKAHAVDFFAIGNPLSSASVGALGVSGDGSVVVGNYGSQPFVWTQTGGLSIIQSPTVLYPFTPGIAHDVSADGSTIVGYSNISFSPEAFRWISSGGMVSMGELPGGAVGSVALGVSADGSVITGFSRSGTHTLEAFVWTANGGMVGLGDLPGGSLSSQANGISDNGLVIVGESQSALGLEAFRWTANGGMQGLGLRGSGGFSVARDASADGSVIVGEASLGQALEAYRWTESGGYTILGDLPGDIVQSRAYGVSADGSIIVGVGRTALGDEAYIWDETLGMRNLKEVLEAGGINLAGWRLITAYDISADGTTIVGSGINPQGLYQSWVANVSVVPIPSTIWLFGSGILAFITFMKKKKSGG